MYHRESYKGRSISVWTIKRREGYSWEFQIDVGKIQTGCGPPLKHEDVALKEGIGEARWAAGRMEQN